jgi:hypothetical protein
MITCSQLDLKSGRAQSVVHKVNAEYTACDFIGKVAAQFRLHGAIVEPVVVTFKPDQPYCWNHPTWATTSGLEIWQYRSCRCHLGGCGLAVFSQRLLGVTGRLGVPPYSRMTAERGHLDFHERIEGKRVPESREVRAGLETSETLMFAYFARDAPKVHPLTLHLELLCALVLLSEANKLIERASDAEDPLRTIAELLTDFVMETEVGGAARTNAEQSFPFCVVHAQPCSDLKVASTIHFSLRLKAPRRRSYSLKCGANPA